jgi:hypothetical protein
MADERVVVRPFEYGALAAPPITCPLLGLVWSQRAEVLQQD